MNQQNHGLLTPFPRAPGGFSRLRHVCARVGVTSRAVRHYEMLGLIKCDRRPDGSRVLGDEAQGRLTIIATLRAAGVGLPAIGALFDEGGDLNESVRALLLGQLKHFQDQSLLVSLLLNGQLCRPTPR